MTICVSPPLAQNIELVWESPRVRRMLERYASFSRQVIFDKRGTGLSDRSLDVAGLDERVDKLRAVMDDAGVDRGFVHGVSKGGPMAIMFAATYPDRVDGLILEGTAASLLSEEARDVRSTPAGRAAAEERWQAFVQAWGTPRSRTLELFSPSLLADPEIVSWDAEAVYVAIEEFTTGRVRASAGAEVPLRRRRVEVEALGRFEVPVDGEQVAAAEWGSRQARTVLGRLVAGRGWPVTREELIDILWPDERSDRLGARLSVQLSAVRRVLGGGVVADRSTVRLDLSAVSVDLEGWFRLTDDRAVVEGFADPLPEYRYEDWARAAS